MKNRIIVESLVSSLIVTAAAKIIYEIDDMLVITIINFLVLGCCYYLLSKFYTDKEKSEMEITQASQKELVEVISIVSQEISLLKNTAEKSLGDLNKAFVEELYNRSRELVDANNKISADILLFKNANEKSLLDFAKLLLNELNNQSEAKKKMYEELIDFNNNMILETKLVKKSLTPIQEILVNIYREHKKHNEWNEQIDMQWKEVIELLNKHQEDTQNLMEDVNNFTDNLVDFKGLGEDLLDKEDQVICKLEEIIEINNDAKNNIDNLNRLVNSSANDICQSSEKLIENHREINNLIITKLVEVTTRNYETVDLLQNSYKTLKEIVETI